MADSWRRNGFTLIEVLIAMTLLGIMVVLLFSSLKIAAESWNAGEGKIVEVSRKAVVYQFFKRHLTTIRPVLAQSTELENAGTEVAVIAQAFKGQRQTLRFVAALPVAAARKGLQVFDIAADRNEPSTIMVGLTPYQQTEPGEPEWTVLLQHVKAFTFAYFGKKEEADEAAWHDDWMDIDHLPQLIKVGIRLDDDSYWPDMVFPLKINALPATENVASDDSESTVP
ncbi:MAG: prepilin-type N-terminal cleavage/methylation domain-containing protein [Methylococcaceae bacterium]|nr:prepilin-type N-terminal cleavage/methylation domain-containing protein [Methylococcaceae bacterium]